MNPQTNRARNFVISLIAIVATIGAVTFIIRSGPPTQTAAAATDPPVPTIDTHRVMTRSDVATDPGLADRIRERISSQEGIDALSPQQIEQFVSQSAAVIQVRAGGEFDDYLDLMKSWNGECLLGAVDLEMLRPGWKPPDHPVAIAIYGIDQLTIKVSAASPKKSRHFVGATGISSLVTMSQFKFQADRQALVESGAKQISITMPCQMNSGETVERTDVYLWSSVDSGWIPLHTTLSTKEGQPMPRTIF